MRAMPSLTLPAVSIAWSSWTKRKFYIPTVSIQLLVLLVYFLISQGYAGRRGKIQKQLRHGGAEALRHDAALLYKNLYARHGQPAFIEIWYTEWPGTFRKFSPQHVGSYIDGLTIAVARTEENEEGLFVVPESMDHEPTPAHGTTYERITNGIYWYSYAR